jgi:hypothetical protein
MGGVVVSGSVHSLCTVRHFASCHSFFFFRLHFSFSSSGNRQPCAKCASRMIICCLPAHTRVMASSEMCEKLV